MTHIRPRADWSPRYSNGAGPAPLPATDGAFLHHSVTKARNGPEAIRELEQIGQSRFRAGISYTIPVSPDGTAWEGHGIDRLGSHTKGHNTKGRGIVLIGNYADMDPTPAAREKVAQVLAHGVRHRWWPTTSLRPHSAVRATECPGDRARAAIPGMVARADALLAGGAPIDPADPTPTRTIIRQGDTGEDVRFLQAMLNIITPHARLGDRRPLAVDGDYGPRTAARVLEFERWSNGMARLAGARIGLLQEDGIATQPTMAAVAFWVPVALQA